VGVDDPADGAPMRTDMVVVRRDAQPPRHLNPNRPPSDHTRYETRSDQPCLFRNEIDPGSANHTCLSFLGLSQSRVELGVSKLDDTC
jgi:hypothetical protein